MDNLTVNIFAYPVLPYTLLTGLVFIYWLVAALGFLDIDVLDIESPDGDMDGDSLDALAGLLMKLGLNGVPLTLVVTFISLYGFIAVAVPSMFLEVFMVGNITKLVIGTPLLIAVTYVAIKLTSISIIPLRKFFKKMEVYTEKKLIGQACTVRTSKVTEKFGEATFNDGGAGLILKIRAPEERGFKNGDTVILLEYLEHEDAYRVVSEDDFKYGQ
jgi:hypothetical protein